MGYYYEIYVIGVVVAYFLLHKRIHMLREMSGKVSFWTAALLGLMTPFVFERSELFVASMVYIAMAVIVAWGLSNYRMGQGNPAVEGVRSSENMSSLSNSILDNTTMESDVDVVTIPSQGVSVTAVNEVFDEFILLQTSHQYDKAIALAQKIQQATEFPIHIRQLMAMELADLYMKQREYSKALKQLQFIAGHGDLSDELQQYVRLQMDAITTPVREEIAVGDMGKKENIKIKDGTKGAVSE